MSDDTGDLDEQTMTGKSTTSAMRAVKRSITEEKIRDEYRDKELQKMERSVYAQRTRLDNLEKRLPEQIDPIDMDRRLLKIEQAVGLMKWVGGALGGTLLSGLGYALLKLLGGE